ncbi:hypothetical protein E3U43_019423 [Larimichthys crocea]|uniref:Uncharacterized protein n=1 Tax=Larimichthys crocea TaxID=215358 RepID=A0ACD3QTJ8_LARCR|nr:hypothetical protein E3U43_019423 [Larimichthys crocea]
MLMFGCLGNVLRQAPLSGRALDWCDWRETPCIQITFRRTSRENQLSLGTPTPLLSTSTQ